MQETAAIENPASPAEKPGRHKKEGITVQPTALRTMPISFPGLFGNWEFNPDPVAIHIGHGIYWYGIILAIAMLCGMWLAMKQAKHYGLTEDDITNLVLWAVPCCIVGSRAYYVIFNLNAYRTAEGGLDWGRIVAVWDGGIAMYGTIIMGVLVALAYSLFRKIPFGATADTAVLGLILGQAIGRWANLINREAYGTYTTLPWRMRLWYNHARYMEVHPTFLYESLWNLLGLLLLLFIISKGRRFDGENICFYFLWYGLGRLWIEGLRTDSLYFFDWTFFGERVRVSQALSLFAALGGALVLWFQIRVRKKTADGLYVNRLAAQRDAEQAEAAAKADAETDTAENPEADAGTDNAEADADTDNAEAAADTDSTKSDAEAEPDTNTETNAEMEQETEAGADTAPEDTGKEETGKESETEDAAHGGTA